MIYVSSASIRTDRIGDAVRTLAESGFRNIELSGGTVYYPEWKTDLLQLKEEFSLNFLLHNYFPPPREPFILNLASLNREVFERSLAHYKDAIAYSRELGARRFGLHAGFYYDPKLIEIGETLSYSRLYPKDEADERFIEGFEELHSGAAGVKLYVENHVLSQNNFNVFKSVSPVMLTGYADFADLSEKIKFPILLDLAHLYVSCRTLGLDYERESLQLTGETDYIHISGNSGESDTNEAISIHSPIIKPLAGMDLGKYTITLEVYGSLEEIKQSIAVLQSGKTSLEP